jgi:UDP-glucose 4-epimerase
LAAQQLLNGANSATYNLGNGNGFSVKEVIDTALRVTGKQIEVKSSPRREGDPARLVADATRTRRELKWQPRRDDLDVIIEDAWRWECSR